MVLALTFEEEEDAPEPARRRLLVYEVSAKGSRGGAFKNLVRDRLCLISYNAV